MECSPIHTLHISDIHSRLSQSVYPTLSVSSGIRLAATGGKIVVRVSIACNIVIIRQETVRRNDTAWTLLNC